MDEDLSLKYVGNFMFVGKFCVRMLVLVGN